MSKRVKYFCDSLGFVFSQSPGMPQTGPRIQLKDKDGFAFEDSRFRYSRCKKDGTYYQPSPNQKAAQIYNWRMGRIQRYHVEVHYEITLLRTELSGSSQAKELLNQATLLTARVKEVLQLAANLARGKSND